jgi:RNA polymerase sigma-70 factor (ECF subfamily)
MSVGAVDVAVHRMRRRYGELLREEIGCTVGDPAEVEEEIRHLKEVLGRG